MSWTVRCFQWAKRFNAGRGYLPGSEKPCSGGFCHACEGCDTHCNCADTDEPRHVAGMNLGELP